MTCFPYILFNQKYITYIFIKMQFYICMLKKKATESDLNFLIIIKKLIQVEQ